MKNQVAVKAFFVAVKNFTVSVINDFKEAQRNLDAVREKINQRSK